MGTDRLRTTQGMDAARGTHLIRFRCSAMKVSDNSQTCSGQGLQSNRGVHQPRQHRSQMEPAIEVVPRRAGVGSGMIALLDGVIAPTRGALDVGQYPLDPARSWRFAGSAKTGGHQHEHGMRGWHPCNAQSKPVRRCAPRRLATGVFGTLRPGKRCRRFAPVSVCMVRVIQGKVPAGSRLHGAGDPKLRWTQQPPRTSAPQALRNGSCSRCADRRGKRRQLQETAQTTRRFAFGHGLHDFVLDRPRRVAGRIPMTCPLQHRQLRLGRVGKCGANVDVVKGMACLETACRGSATET